MNILLVSSLESFLQLIGVLLIVVFVLWLTYAATKWMGNYQKMQSWQKNLRILDTIRIGNNKFICIVQAGIRYLVVAVGKDEIHMLAELSESELRDLSFLDESPQKAQGSFQEILNQLKEKIPKK